MMKLLRGACLLAPLALLVLAGPFSFAQNRPQEPPAWESLPSEYGPYNATVLPGGNGLEDQLIDGDPVLEASHPWTLLAWFNAEKPEGQNPAGPDSAAGLQLLAGIGSPSEDSPRYLALAPGKAVLWLGPHNALEGPATLGPGSWHLLAATFDGQHFRLYADGSQVAQAWVLLPGQSSNGAALAIASVSPILEIAPAPRPSYEPAFDRAAPSAAFQWQHFGGKIYGLEVLRSALSLGDIRQTADSHPDFTLPVYDQASKAWPVQTRGQAGYNAPQSPQEMPHSKAPFQSPRPIPASTAPAPAPAPGSDNLWTLDGGWRLLAAPKVQAAAAQISSPAFDAQSWYAAVVPGTVLTTLVDRGVYPNPYYGLNNLAIPESLNKQDYWYRTEFRAPESTKGKRLTLTFEGINYHADVWLNGRRLGDITGAFIRGIFDVTGVLRPGATNVLAVRIAPPPHPGIPQEQSIKGGPGENGGIMCLDGPTFVATEGWDWIPGIRDRDSGIWQPVTLRATGPVQIGDPQVVTTLPLPDTSSAKIDVTVPVTNAGDTPVHGTLRAEFEGVTVTKEVDLKAGANSIGLTPAEFPQLNLQHPRLWWPNGYGPQNLYHLKLTFTASGRVSDSRQLQFGVREITYELSLLDPSGHLRRVEYSPTAARADPEPDVDVAHNGMRSIPAADPPPPNLPAAWRAHWYSWVASLTAAGEKSPAVQPSTDTGTAPYLVIKVNGVRIACRGGNWGMDDAMKDVSRAHLEPYFRLHHDAGENILRNWVGQSTEETLYDLADQYGFLIWNDFWETTENYNIEAENPALFLANAKDVILRFRNHPSIAVWCGRNEGVPQPIINQGLDNLVRTFDGTRYYNPSSNEVNLQGSGPYRYQDPKLYFTVLNHGFSVETGTPSMSTLESFEAWTPKPDQWPMDDVWAYHDWHFKGNGDIHPFMDELQAEFGAPTSLADFERKAQMMDYVDYRAVFEGMDAHLWSPNSGRLLWMTQPAWPSNMWEVLSYDYDTQSSYYGEKEALQPLHVQLNLASNVVDVVNTTPAAPGPLQVVADAYSLDNRSLLHQESPVTVPADGESAAMHLDLAPLDRSQVILLHLQLQDQSGKVVSSNLYWLSADSRNYRQLSRLPDATVTAAASSACSGSDCTLHVELKNTGSDVALQNKLTLVDSSTGKRILPAYYSDNYVSLLPGEARTVEIQYPADAARGASPGLTLRAFNLPQRKVEVAAQ